MNICIVRGVARAMLPGLLGWMTLADAPVAWAQSSHIVSASVETCNVRAVVRTTVLGVTTTTALACVNPTLQVEPGEDQNTLVDTFTVGIPAVANVVTVTGPSGASSWVDAPQTTDLDGDVEATTLRIAQGGIQISGLTGHLTCQSESDGDLVSCAAETTVGTITVAGRSVALPAQPLPVNHPIAIAGLQLGVSVLGLQLAIPVTGQLVLNQVKVVKTVATDSELAFEHAPLALTLRGSVHLLGLGLIAVELEVTSFARIEVVTPLPSVP